MKKGSKSEFVAENSSVAIHVDSDTGTDWHRLALVMVRKRFLLPLPLFFTVKTNNMQFYLQPPQKQGHYCFNGLLQLTKQPLFPDMSIIITLSYMTQADEYSILASSLSRSAWLRLLPTSAFDCWDHWRSDHSWVEDERSKATVEFYGMFPSYNERSHSWTFHQGF